MRKRISIIWTTSKDDVLTIVNSSFTISEILSKFGLTNKGYNYRTLRKRLEEDNIKYSHILPGRNAKGRPIKRSKIELDLILVEHSSYNRCHLKNRLIKAGLLINKCYICEQLPLWNSKPLSLQLDHINGISDDNRLENLRLLCPNCHSQTDNFAGRNKK